MRGTRHTQHLFKDHTGLDEIIIRVRRTHSGLHTRSNLEPKGSWIQRDSQSGAPSFYWSEHVVLLEFGYLQRERGP